MPSHTSKMIYKIMTLFKFNQRLAEKIASDDFGIETHTKPSPKMVKKYDIKTIETEGRKTYIWNLKDLKKQPIIFYLHGGAFVGGQISLHFHFFKELINQTDCVMIVPDYPLVPHAHVDDIYNYLDECYKSVSDLCENQHMIFMGDSAGGGLAVGLAQRLYEKYGLKKQQLMLLSPWLDVSMSHPKINEIQKEDPILNHETLKKIGRMYTGKHDIDNPLVRPLLGTFDGIDYISVWTGTRDILYADALQLAEILSITSVKFDMHIYQDMLHTWMFFGIKESKQAINEMAQKINHI
ncbi:MAG: alpha/beta hydrolase [Acholeplasmataceae bacterium]|nr:alpha/beta hydrolase [Acholeplasmataceae bacterium]